MTKTSHGGGGEHKGNPEGTGRQNTGLNDAFKGTDQTSEKQVISKYMDGDDDVSQNAQTRHPNRNTDKGEDQQGKDNDNVAKANIGAGDARNNW